MACAGACTAAAIALPSTGAVIGTGTVGGLIFYKKIKRF